MIRVLEEGNRNNKEEMAIKEIMAKYHPELVKATKTQKIKLGKHHLAR